MRKLDELYHEASQRGLVYPNAKYTKAQLMDKLATYYRKQHSGLLLPQHAVMLARNVKDISEVQLEKMLDAKSSSPWVAEEKLDELRAKLHLGATSNRIDTRHISDVTYEYNERTAQLPHLANMMHQLAGTVLDGGLQSPVEKINCGKTKTVNWLTSTTAIVNSSPERAMELQRAVGCCNFYVWDILFYCGNDVRNMRYEARYSLLIDIREQLANRYIKMLPRCVQGIEAFYKKIVRAGGEGIMLKHLEMPYIDAGPGGCRRPKAMYKMKKHKEVDCFITGYVPGEGEFSGLVGSLLVSVMKDNRQVEIGAIQPGDLTFRNAITVPGSGELIQDMYNKVVEVSYLCKTKNNRMAHAVIGEHGFRATLFNASKTANQCTEF